MHAIGADSCWLLASPTHSNMVAMDNHITSYLLYYKSSRSASVHPSGIIPSKMRSILGLIEACLQGSKWMCHSVEGGCDPYISWHPLGIM